MVDYSCQEMCKCALCKHKMIKYFNCTVSLLRRISRYASTIIVKQTYHNSKFWSRPDSTVNSRAPMQNPGQTQIFCKPD